MALNIFMKYNIKEDTIKDRIYKLINILNKAYLKSFFHKLKSIKTNSKTTIPPHILSNISNLYNPMEKKLNENNRDNYLTNENTVDTKNTKNTFSKNNNLKYNNSMANINPHLLNISTNPDFHDFHDFHSNNNNNYNNSSFYDNNLADNIINNYTYDKRDKQIKMIELSNTYSTKYFRPKNYFNQNNINKNNNNNKNKQTSNYMSKTSNNSKKNQFLGGKFKMNISNSNSKNNCNNNYNLSTPKSNKLKTKAKVNLDYLNYLSKSKTEHNLIPEKTSQYIKEQEEINNYCTFKPKINRSSSFSYYKISNKKSIERLYLDSKNRIARKEMEALKKTNLESKENTFQPRFVSSSVKKVKSNFDKRLKDFEILKKNKINKIATELENDQKLHYTFNPKINNSSINNNNNTSFNASKATSHNQSMISKRNKIPAFKRLYDDNKDKILRQEERVKQEMEKIKKNSSKLSENNNNSYDTKKIEELYNDYKSKKNRLKKKQEQIEKEQGITFKPSLISEKKYYEKINPNFFEREKQFLEKQQQNIESYKLLIENEQNQKKKKYTEDEKKEIYNNIVSRLYKDGVEKYIQKKQLLDNNIADINNENEMKDSLMEKNTNCKNRGINENKKIDEIEYEPEPEEEIFKPNSEIIGLNENYEQIFQNKNINKDKNCNLNVNPKTLIKNKSSIN
jgi:hypothetical protein